MAIERVNGTELRFKNPGWLLLVVISFLFVGVGFLDLIGHTSAEPDIFGLYSLPFFVFILLYATLLVLWIVLFFNNRLLSLIVDGVRYIQSRTWLALVVFAGLCFALWVIFEWDRWSRLPGLQFAAFGLVVLAGFILLFTDWSKHNSQQAWRKVVAYPMIGLLVVEAILQILAFAGSLPGVRAIGGNFYPYERVYYKGESTHNRFANRYGWYSPDQKLENDKRRILIVGGSYVQGLQVKEEENFGVLLSKRINEKKSEKNSEIDVVSMGMSGFGLTSFLFDDSMRELPHIIEHEEMIVLFHLGDDFQSPVDSHTSIRYTIESNGEVRVHPADARLRHDLTHYYLRGYMSFQLVETIRNNYLTSKVVSSIVNGRAHNPKVAGISTDNEAVNFPRIVGFVVNNYAVTEPGHAGIKTTDIDIIDQGNNFMFKQGDSEDIREATVIAEGILKVAQEYALANNITLRVVTVPAFPANFFEMNRATEWKTQFGGYDLLQPEEVLVEIAKKYHISILPMGKYMLQDRLSTEDIRSLFSTGGYGFFTQEGHQYFSEAIYDCFCSEKASNLCSD
jgi:hypothetical protein